MRTTKVVGLSLIVLFIALLTFTLSYSQKKKQSPKTYYDEFTFFIDGVMYAEGEGMGKPDTSDPDNPFKAELKAKKIALTHAQKNLIEKMIGLSINSVEIVKDVDEIETRIEKYVYGAIAGYEIVGEKCERRGKYVKCITTIKVILDEAWDDAIEYQMEEEQKDIQSGELNVVEVSDRSIVPEGIYTGLIIETRGFKIRPAICPKIVDESGRIVYGAFEVDKADDYPAGVVGYAKLKKDAEERVGNNPLTIEAIKESGKRKTDIVISNSDAQKILVENEKTKFFDKAGVVFLVD